MSKKSEVVPVMSSKSTGDKGSSGVVGGVPVLAYVQFARSNFGCQLLMHKTRHNPPVSPEMETRRRAHGVGITGWRYSERIYFKN